jgi:Ndr family.
MSEIKERSIFIHIDVPGHEDNAPNLPDRYVYVCVCVCVCIQNIWTGTVSRISFTGGELFAVIEKVTVIITFRLVSSLPDYWFIY